MSDVATAEQRVGREHALQLHGAAIRDRNTGVPQTMYQLEVGRYDLR